MARWLTIVPLHNVRLTEDLSVKFGNGLVVGSVPNWLLADRLVKNLGSRDHWDLVAARYAFLVSYEADSLGDPDPEWQGNEPRSIQEAKYELAVLGNLAIWLSFPSPVCFTTVLHAPHHASAPCPSVQQSSRQAPLLCSREDASKSPSAEDLNRASKLHTAMMDVAREGALWTAIRTCWLGLTVSAGEVRYILLWVALEALFGPDDAREMTYRLCERTALFLECDRKQAGALFAKAKKGYSLRSKVVHGRWSGDPQSETRMAETEMLLRRSLVRILDDRTLVDVFSGKEREAYLDDLVFG